jgi:hypothetical protein
MSFRNGSTFYFLISFSFLIVVGCKKIASENKTEMPEIIYSDTSIANGIVVIAEDKKLKKEDSLHVLIGLENRELTDSFLITVDGKELKSNSDGWFEHTFILSHWGGLFSDIRSRQKTPLKSEYTFRRYYEIITEIDFSIKNKNDDLLYKNENNAIEIYIEDYSVLQVESPRIKVENGKLIQTGSFSYNIIPDVSADSCYVNLKICGIEKKYVYKVIERTN